MEDNFTNSKEVKKALEIIIEEMTHSVKTAWAFEKICWWLGYLEGISGVNYWDRSTDKTGESK